MAGIYLHIPYCKQKCHYCNFHFSTSQKGKEDLLKALHKELEIRESYLNGEAVSTVYLGGGTPSLLLRDDIQQLGDTIRKHYPSENIQEFTLEANPDDLTPDYLRALKHTPVNRLSIGIQSFHNADLQYMNRAHNAQQALQAVKDAQDAGYDNLTIDLIYGVPGLSDGQWRRNLEQIAALQIPHFSAYALTVEEGTFLSHAIRKKQASSPLEEQAARQFEILMDMAPALGYEHYEISNFAQPGRYAVHNTRYWQGVPYLGAGPSAHSFNGKSRRWNIANNTLYTQYVLAGSKVFYEEEILTDIQQINEYVMTSLRTMWGCDLAWIEDRWGNFYMQAIMQLAKPFTEKQWVLQEKGKLFLTKAGKLFADGVAGALFLEK